MQVKVYIIDIPIPKRFLKAAAYVSAAVMVLALRSDVNATPTHFSSGTTLTAAALQTLNIAVNGTVQYSVGPTAYACAAPTTTGGNLGGYTGAKSMCETACRSPTAHMCTSEEILRSLQLGYTLPDGGYYSTFIPIEAGSHADCDGWTMNSSMEAPTFFLGTSIGGAACNQAIPVLCCD